MACHLTKLIFGVTDFDLLGVNFDLAVRLMRATAGRPYEEESEINKIGTVKMLPHNLVGATIGRPPPNWDLSVSKDRAPAWSPPKGGYHAQASPFKGRLPRLRGW